VLAKTVPSNAALKSQSPSCETALAAISRRASRIARISR
jgi:hypothetical protein